MECNDRTTHGATGIRALKDFVINFQWQSPKQEVVCPVFALATVSPERHHNMFQSAKQTKALALSKTTHIWSLWFFSTFCVLLRSFSPRPNTLFAVFVPLWNIGCTAWFLLQYNWLLLAPFWHLTHIFSSTGGSNEGRELRRFFPFYWLRNEAYLGLFAVVL